MTMNHTTPQSDRAVFTPQIDELQAMAQQDVEVLRQRLADGSTLVKDFVAREPVKALGLALCAGVVLGWLTRRR
jgi:ElaB/YqjD/DUF883 family membrane-anchored ribosome-binding protein